MAVPPVEYRGSRGQEGEMENFTPLLARGSARSVNQVVQLVKDQHLLHRLEGIPCSWVEFTG